MRKIIVCTHVCVCACCTGLIWCSSISSSKSSMSTLLPPSVDFPSFHSFYSVELNCFRLQWAQGKVLPCCHSVQLPCASRCSIDLWGPSTCVCVHARVCVPALLRVCVSVCTSVCVSPVFIGLIKVSWSFMSSPRAVSLKTGNQTRTQIHTQRLHKTASSFIIYLSCLQVFPKLVRQTLPSSSSPWCLSPFVFLR